MSQERRWHAWWRAHWKALLTEYRSGRVPSQRFLLGRFGPCAGRLGVAEQQAQADQDQDHDHQSERHQGRPGAVVPRLREQPREVEALRRAGDHREECDQDPGDRAAGDVAAGQEHGRARIRLLGRRPFDPVDNPADQAADEDRHRGRERQVDSHRERQGRDACQVHHDRDEDADDDQPPGELPRHDAVDDEGHQRGLRRGELGHSRAVVAGLDPALDRRDRSGSEPGPCHPPGTCRARFPAPGSSDPPDMVCLAPGTRSDSVELGDVGLHVGQVLGLARDDGARVVEQQQGEPDDDRRGERADQDRRSAASRAWRRPGSPS